MKSKGAFRQEKNGRWSIDTKIKVNNEFKHFKRTGYPTLSAAKADFERAKQEFISSKSTSINEVLTFNELFSEYEIMRRHTVNITTIYCDQSLFNVYFKPYFDKKLIKDVFKESIIKDWYENLVDNPMITYNKKSKVITRMKDLLKFAYTHKYIDSVAYQDCDVCMYQVKYNKTANVERVIWTDEEENDFYKAIENDKRDKVLFTIFLNCGARIGEFLGLQVNCFDYSKCRITIKQQVLNIAGQGNVLTNKLKTHDSYRTVALTQSNCDLLEDYITTLGLKENDFLFFTNDPREPMARNTFRRRLYYYCDVAKVRKINPHASRHIQAVKLSKVAMNGAELEAAARRLGHSPEMFLNTYAKHRQEETELELLNRIAKA